MALFSNIIQKFAVGNFNAISSKLTLIPSFTQTRSKHYIVDFHGSKNYWPKWTMMKDQRKRMTLQEYGRFKLRLNALRKNDILPPELQEIANHEIFTMPRDAAMNRIVRRCAVTSRPRGTVFRWKLSRLVFKHLADNNKLSGVQRALWG